MMIAAMMKVVLKIARRGKNPNGVSTFTENGPGSLPLKGLANALLEHTEEGAFPT